MLETTGNLFAQNTDGIAVVTNAVVQASGRSYLELSVAPACARWSDFDLILGSAVTKYGLRFRRLTDSNRRLQTPDGREYQLPYDLYLCPVAWTWWGPVDLTLISQTATQLAKIPGSIALPHLEGENNRRDAWKRALPILDTLLAGDRFVVVKSTLTQRNRSVPLPKIPERFFKAEREVRQNGRKPYGH